MNAAKLNPRALLGAIDKSRDLIFIVLLCIVALLFFARWYTPYRAAASDGDAYLMLARSLAEGKGYRDIHLPEEPIATHYPVGWPFLLSFVYRWFGLGYLAYRVFMAILYIATAVVLYLLGRQFVSAWPSFLISYSLTAHVVIAQTTQTTLAEIPFCLALYGGLLLYCHGERKSSNAACIGGLACLVFATFLKFYGEIVLPAVFLALLMKRKWKLLAAFCLLIIIKIGIQFGVQGSAWIAKGKVTHQPLIGSVMRGSADAAQTMGLFHLCVANLRRMLLTHIPHNLFPTLYHLYSMNKLKALVCLFFSLWVLAGLAFALIRRQFVLALAGGAVMAGLLTRSDGPWIYRYYAPAAAFFALFGVLGVRDTLRHVRRRYCGARFAKLLLYAFSIVLVLDKAVYNEQVHRQIDLEGQKRIAVEFEELCTCIRESTPQNALLFSPAASSLTLAADRKAIGLLIGEQWDYSWEDNTLKSIAEMIRQYNPGYVVFPGYWTSAVSFDLKRFEEKLLDVYPCGTRRIVYGSRNPTSVYAITPDPSSADSCAPLGPCLAGNGRGKSALSCRFLCTASPPDTTQIRETAPPARYNPSP